MQLPGNSASIEIPADSLSRIFYHGCQNGYLFIGSISFYAYKKPNLIQQIIHFKGFEMKSSAQEARQASFALRCAENFNIGTDEILPSSLSRRQISVPWVPDNSISIEPISWSFHHFVQLSLFVICFYGYSWYQVKHY